MAGERQTEDIAFTFDAKDLEVLCEALWHAFARADVPGEDHERIRLLRERLNSAR